MNRKILATITILSFLSFLVLPKKAEAVLSDSLVAYWSLEEESGTRLDQLTGCGGGGCDLTDNNTVLFAAGKQGNAADFEDTADEYLSRADDGVGSTLDITGDISFSAWVQVENAPSSTTMRLITKYGGAGAESYMFEIKDTGGTKSMQLVLYDTGERVGNINGDLGTGTLRHAVVTFDNTANLAEYWIDGVSQGTVGITVGSLQDGGADFDIGGKHADTTKTWDGLVDEVGLWTKVLSDTEISDLYCNGDGLSYSDITGAGCVAAPTGRGHRIIKAEPIKLEQSVEFNLA